jgi:hypothetical protein
MADIIETTVYRIDELSDAAKEIARAWYRENGFDYEWYDSVYEDFETICTILGIQLKSRSVPLVGGGKRSDPCIWFSGFWNQGDGACFEAYYSYARGSVCRIRMHAPLDTRLQLIADTLRDVQRRNFYQIQAETVHRGRYSHEYCMSVSVERDSPTHRDMASDGDEIVRKAFRDLARWLYRQLEQEYDHISSDEAVDDIIIANGYTLQRQADASAESKRQAGKGKPSRDQRESPGGFP